MWALLVSTVPALMIVIGAAAEASADANAILRRATEERLLPGYETFAAETAALAAGARDYCAGTGGISALKAAYHDAFDAWMMVAPIDFGPIRAEGALESVEYWPDPSDATASAVTFLLAAEDPIVDDAEAFARIAAQARGLTALEWLLFDRRAPAIEPGGYPCRLVEAIAQDLQRIGDQTARDWRARFAAAFAGAGEPANALFPSAEDALHELYRALAEGVQETRELRVLRPLASPERPAPQAAEAWRSERPLRNVRLVLGSLSKLAETAFLPALDPDQARRVREAFAAAESAVEGNEPPLSKAVADRLGREALEELSAALRRLSIAIEQQIGAPLGLGPDPKG